LLSFTQVLPNAILVSGLAVVAAGVYSLTGGEGKGATGFSNSETTADKVLPLKWARSARLTPKKQRSNKWYNSVSVKGPAKTVNPLEGVAMVWGDKAGTDC
jgi:hypothetical protein